MRNGRWNRVILRDICEKVNYGYTASAKQDKVGPKFLRITDIVPDLIDWSTVPYCKISDKNLPKYQLKKGDIVIARTGATTGYAKWIRGEHEAVFASYLVRIIINQEHDNRYVGFVVESDEYKRFIKTNISGAAQPQANAQVLTSFPIPLPPLPTQRKIGAILSAYDDLIENNTRRIQILEEMAQTIYREWFVHFRFPGHERVRIVESEMGLIPEGWEVRTLGEILNFSNGKSIKAGGSGQFPVYGSNGIIGLSDEYRYKEGVIIGRVGAYCGSIEYCRTPFWSSDNTIVAQPKYDFMDIEYFYYKLKELNLNNYAGGSAQPLLTQSTLRQLKTIVPPNISTEQIGSTSGNNNLIIRFTKTVDPIFSEIENFTVRNFTLRKTRDLLLPKLISGEIDVSELDIDISEV